MQLDFHTLDVFTDRRFAGNPLAVVLDAGALTDEQMQAIAGEFNLSETVFFLPPKIPPHSARVRIFTPTRELPFAGHPTVGAAILNAELRANGSGADGDAVVVLEQNIGVVRVGVRMRPGTAAFAEFDAPKLPLPAGVLAPVEKIAAALGLIPSEIGFENHRPTCFAAGPAFAFVPIASMEAMAKAGVSGAHWGEAFREQGLVGVYLYTRECQHMTSAFHARMLAPDAGMPEDPATGSAAVCLAGVIGQFDGLTEGTHRRLIEQGYEMGRPSLIALTLIVDKGKLSTVRIGGQAVRVSSGTLTV